MRPTDFLEDARGELGASSYVPLAHLASGSFGDVFVVRHRDLGTELVLKLLKPEFRTNADVVERLKVEARIVTRLAHRNVIRVTDFGWSRSGRPFLVTEKLTGEPLLDRVKRERALPLETALDLGLQMLSGLACVHEAKLVHRDVKPANLFLALEGGRTVLKILDFGIAKVVDPSEGAALGRQLRTAEGMVLGTPAYLAPEQITGKTIDARTDIYAAGCVIYRMIAGRPPFLTQTQDELIIAHLTVTPELVSEHAPYPVPMELDAVLARALAKSAEERFESASAFAEALQAAATRTATTPTPPPAGVKRGTIPMRGRGTELMPLPTPVPERPAYQLDYRGSPDPEEGTVYATGPRRIESARPERAAESADAAFEMMAGQRTGMSPVMHGARPAQIDVGKTQRRLVVLLIGVIIILSALVLILSARVLR